MNGYWAVLTLRHGNIPADVDLIFEAIDLVNRLEPESPRRRVEEAHCTELIWWFDRPLTDLTPMVGRLVAIACPDWAITLSAEGRPA